MSQQQQKKPRGKRFDLGDVANGAEMFLWFQDSSLQLIAAFLVMRFVSRPRHPSCSLMLSPARGIALTSGLVSARGCVCFAGKSNALVVAFYALVCAALLGFNSMLSGHGLSQWTVRSLRVAKLILLVPLAPCEKHCPWSPRGYTITAS